MESGSNRDVFRSPTDQLAVSGFMSKVYMWMTMGIVLTGIVAMGIAGNEEILMTIATNKLLLYGAMFAEIVLVLWLSARINTLSSVTATSLFLVYAALNGVTLSIFSLIYTSESIQSSFFVTGFGFAGLSAFGFITKKDLGPVGNFCSMGLFGLIGMAILSIFFPSLMGGVAGQVYGLVGLIVFAGLTAYDTQRIKQMAPSARDTENFQKGAIMGALKLYLDFINLFLFVLRMNGKRR